MSSKKLFFEAPERNKEPIVDVLRQYCSTSNQQNCLEISSGTGQHVVHFAEILSHVTFQPSELNPTYLSSIEEYVQDSGLKNILPPLFIDITSDISIWKLPQKEYDLCVNINMIHITAWECTVALFEKIPQVLKQNGLLFTYGPYALHGEISPESNVRFHKALQSENPDWGLRDIDDICRIASHNGLKLENIHDMPSNNKTLVWRKI